MTIKPLNDRVLIEPAKAEEVVGGIIIPEAPRKSPSRASFGQLVMAPRTSR